MAIPYSDIAVSSLSVSSTSAITFAFALADVVLVCVRLFFCSMRHILETAPRMLHFHHLGR